MTEETQQEILDRLIVVEDMLADIRRILSTFNIREKNIMVTVQDIQTKANQTLDQVRAETDIANAVKTVVENQVAQLQALQQQIADLIASGGGDPAALQALSDTVDQILAANTANADIVSQAVVEGTPAQQADAAGGTTSVDSTDPTVSTKG